uniref:Cysteine-rich receptor-like protein kinase 10 n=1 Tax=Populus alba TaxID=43335 RepID=A0A4U5NLU6_POPAL|nr:cysteine-rich receptor-like protein kinase 10 [Populus alba]
MKSLNFFIALLSLLSLATITKSQDPSYLYHVCSNETTYTRNSTYQANLNLLLSSLVSNATRNNLNGFYNSSIGLDPDDVYGLFLCRGDVSKNACHNCVALAAEEAIQRCPVEKVVILWYDLCLLRYSNRAFFSTMDQDPGVTLVNTQNIADEPERFNRLVATTMNDTATRATSVPSGAKKFAVKEVSFKEFQNLYSLVQCTPDLSSSDCNRCLRIAISTLPSCCSQKPGARVLYPSCNIRYEIYEFYNKTAVAAESPPPPPPEIRAPPPSPVSGSKGKVRVSTVVIIAIVVPVGVSIALFCLGFCFLRRRGRKNRDSVKENDDGDEISTVESLQFDLSSIEAATNNFSPDNKLGEGGFGEVYKNSSFYQSDNGMDLLSYAWKQWTNGTALELMDATLGDSYSRNEITRCLHIALLCVQEDPKNRPTLTTIVLMLTSFSVTLPLPRKPAYCVQSRTGSSLPIRGLESDRSTSTSKSLSVNDMSITELYPR